MNFVLFTYYFIAVFVTSQVMSAETANLRSQFISINNPKLVDGAVRKERASKDVSHEIVVAVKQKNLDMLEKILMDVSYPNSPNYGNHWSREKIGEFVQNKAGRDAVYNYFTEHGAQLVKETPYGEYLTFSASIETWERVLQTEFYHYEVTFEDKTKRAIRCAEYSLSIDIAEHVHTIFHTVQLPHIYHRYGKRTSLPQGVMRTESNLVSNMVTPQLIVNHYSVTAVTTPITSPLSSHAVYETYDVYNTKPEKVSNADLKTFQVQLALTLQNVSGVYPTTLNAATYVTPYPCANPNYCGEGNLDVQYIIGVAAGVPAYVYFDTSDDMVTWITQVAVSTDPMTVYSISWGALEAGFSGGELDTFSTEAMKLGLQGVTLLAASGDDGAPSFQARNSASQCNYHPEFPASNPYVTAVGATVGPEQGHSEVVCQKGTYGAIITSGGGFSNHYSQPFWQSTLVEAYFASVSGTANAPYTDSSHTYNSAGRGYPDVALLGHAYYVTISSAEYSVDGTSASTPVMAAFVSLINQDRLSNGKSTLGFINPLLYAYYASFSLDITSGNNLCTENVCCSEGFYAVPGWDPTTGIGAIDFDQFYAAAMSYVAPTKAPSSAASMKSPPQSLYASMDMMVFMIIIGVLTAVML